MPNDYRIPIRNKDLSLVGTYAWEDFIQTYQNTTKAFCEGAEISYPLFLPLLNSPKARWIELEAKDEGNIIHISKRGRGDKIATRLLEIIVTMAFCGWRPSLGMRTVYHIYRSGKFLKNIQASPVEGVVYMEIPGQTPLEYKFEKV